MASNLEMYNSSACFNVSCGFFSKQEYIWGKELDYLIQGRLLSGVHDLPQTSC